MADFLETTQFNRLHIAPTPRVLIVDDDPLLAEHLKQLVDAAGFDASTAISGAAALAAMHKKFSSIVITDLHMPDMDGLTLCRTLRDEHFNSYVYVMLLTGQDAEPDVLAGLEAGADDYLSKRISSALLVARLRTARRILTLEHSLRSVIDEKNRLATTDALTGASNRRYFTRQLTRELHLADRGRSTLSLLLLDIDHFKRINDRHGHGVGDEVLQEFARRVAQSLPRKVDWYARLGGEEFTVVLPETDLTGAALVAERIRRQVADAAFDASCGPIGVTVSIGISGTAALTAAPSVDALLESADRCLYISKESGRNRVTLANPGAEATIGRPLCMLGTSPMNCGTCARAQLFCSPSLEARRRCMRTFHCDHCGQLVFFENSRCLQCQHALAYLPDLCVIGSLEAVGDGLWRSPLQRWHGHRYRLCANYSDANICNWAVSADDLNPLCLSCRLTRVIPDLSKTGHHEAWYRLEVAKRRLVYGLLQLRLPFRPKAEDPEHGLAFELLADPQQAAQPRVLTGHQDGVIVINVTEADDVERETRRQQLHEPYRTLLGHFRHEIGHYYWDQLIAGTDFVNAFRELFGSEEQDYSQALQRHYSAGPPEHWQDNYISAYASMHPWEDWAESWAHYLHMTDTLETAASFGMRLKPQRNGDPSLQADIHLQRHVSFERMVEDWYPLTYALNCLNRGLGQPDGYPFVLSAPIVAKLRFIHEVIANSAHPAR